MSDEKQLRLGNAIKTLAEINLEAAFKTNLGEVSLGHELGPRLSKIQEHLNVATHFLDGVNRLDVIPLADEVEGLAQRLGSMTGTEPANFIQSRNSLLEEIRGRFDRIEIALRPFEMAEQKKKIGDMLGVANTDIESIRQNIRSEAQSVLANVKKEAESVLAEAREQATAIQSTARNTATGVTVVQAQVHFAELLDTFKAGMKWSGAGAGLGFALFVGYVFWLLDHQPNLQDVPSAIFAAAVRVTILGSLAALVTFLLKIFRANLHMYYHTLHRQQLTNSIQSFVDSARTDEQRDVVLTKLVDAVSAFSSSGLIGTSEDMPNTAKIIIDSLPKLMSKS